MALAILLMQVEAVSKPHLTLDDGVAAFFRAAAQAPTPRYGVHITYYAPLFHQAAPCPQTRSEVLNALL